MVKKKIRMLVLGLALVGKDCGATEVAVLPKDSRLAVSPKNRIKENDAIKTMPSKKRKASTARGSRKSSQKREKINMTKGSSPSSPQPQRTIGEIIHAIIGENGMVYATNKEEIFSGSAAEKVHPRLTQLTEDVKTNIGQCDLNDLDRLSQALMDEIRGIYKTILYACDELPDYTQQEIEAYRSYYIAIKNQLEDIANAIRGRLMDSDND
ncbi:MAG: hypothetical protein LBD60_01840 [Puniceicoccales bacterium]|nr:hypothetical protein [Puniceicoccales bacterium]